MSMCMVQSIEVQQRLSQVMRQTLEQRLVANMAIRAIVVCPACQHLFDPNKRRGAWSNDPYDYHISCSRCSHRFIGTLEVEPVASARALDRPSGIVPMPRAVNIYQYLCPIQTLTALCGIRDAREPKCFPGLAWLNTNRPDVLYSAVQHFGQIDEAIRRARSLN